jgi:hypothetical protein
LFWCGEATSIGVWRFKMLTLKQFLLSEEWVPDLTQYFNSTESIISLVVIVGILPLAVFVLAAVDFLVGRR